MNTRLNVDRFKAARIARAKGLAGASTLLRGLLDRTRASSPLSDLREPLEAKLFDRGSDFTEGWLRLPALTSSAPMRFETCSIAWDRSALRGLSMVRRFPPARRPPCPKAPNSWKRPTPTRPEDDPTSSTYRAATKGSRFP